MSSGSKKGGVFSGSIGEGGGEEDGRPDILATIANNKQLWDQILEEVGDVESLTSDRKEACQMAREFIFGERLQGQAHGLRLHRHEGGGDRAARSGWSSTTTIAAG